MEPEIMHCFTSHSPSTDKKNEMMTLAIQNEIDNIILSDNSTKLSDLFTFLLDDRKFRDFLNNLEDVNIVIPLDSSIWPGYSLLHLYIILKENDENNIDLPETASTNEQDKDTMYHKRIKLCLERGCSVNTKNANGQTPIHLAFSPFRKAVVEELLNHSETNVIDANGLSHLHIACILGDINTVKKYVRSGADVNSRLTRSFNWRKKRFTTPRNIRANSTPLHLAVEFSKRNVVEYLLKHNADVYAEDSLGFTPIHLTMTSNSDLAQMLFKATPNLRESVSSIGLSHLHVATWADDHKALDKLLLNGAQVDRVIDTNVEHLRFPEYYSGKTPLFLAKSNATARRLLKAGADLNAKDPEGITALQRALRHMFIEPAKQFIRAIKRGKANVDSCGMTLLHVACGHLDIKWAKELLRNGADVNARISDRGNQWRGASPLHVVLHQYGMCDSWDGLFEFVELLVENGTDLSIECNGATVLHEVYELFLHEVEEEEEAIDGFSEVLRTAVLLLRSLKSYDVNPVNHEGFSHFHLACLVNDMETATKFLDRGVDVNASMDPSAQESLGFAPLHFAMERRSRDVAYLLLNKGADVNAKDVFGNTPLHLALKRKFVDLPLIEVMINGGADVHAKNEDGETLLYLLWRYGGLTEERLELFWNHGCFTNILDTMEAFSQSRYIAYHV